MRNKAIVLAIGLLILAAIIFFPTQLIQDALSPADRQAAPEKNTANKKLKRTWEASVVFSGQDTGETDTFTVPRGPWRLRWEVDGYPSAASLGFSVFSTDGSSKPIFEKHGFSAPNKGIVKIQRGGEFYILVSSYEANWQLAVENR